MSAEEKALQNVAFYIHKIQVNARLLHRYFNGADIFYIEPDDFNDQEEANKSNIPNKDDAYKEAQTTISRFQEKACQPSPKKQYRFCQLNNPNSLVIGQPSPILFAQEKNHDLQVELSKHWLFSTNPERQRIGETIHYAQQKLLSDVQALVVDLAFKKNNINKENFKEELSKHARTFEHTCSRTLKKHSRKNIALWGINYAFAGAVIAAIAILVSYVVLPLVCPSALTIEPFSFIANLATGTLGAATIKIATGLLTTTATSGFVGCAIGFWRGRTRVLQNTVKTFSNTVGNINTPAPVEKNYEQKVVIRNQIGGGISYDKIPWYQ